MLTTKKLHWKSIAHELFWFLLGDTNIKYLNTHGVRIWNEWADEKGNLGPVYGEQWVNRLPSKLRDTKGQFISEKPDKQKNLAPWAGEYYGRVAALNKAQDAAKDVAKAEGKDPLVINQIQEVISHIKNDPNSRRHIVCAWNVRQLSRMKLPPCHVLFQFYVADGALSCQLYQRSADIFLGVPFNIASYALLTCMTAHVCGLRLGEFVHTFGDLHLYLNHTEQAKTQLQRKPLSPPQLQLSPKIDDIFNFTFDDIQLLNYEAHPHIAAPVAV